MHTCTSCGAVYTRDDCPVCHVSGVLKDALDVLARKRGWQL